MRIAGIDLGTTNCAVASVRGDAKVEVLEVEQFVGPGSLAKSTTLPSFCYLLHESDGSSESFGADSAKALVVGSYAKERGAQVPDRVISSAKSWLCHGQLDRSSHFLPWKADSVPFKISPVEVSALYLKHLKKTLDTSSAADEETKYVLTIPASFDEVARQLTQSAAEQAGLGQVTLLEEPLAAFYAWIDATKDYHKILAPGDTVLVCDVGGGTTDFTLVTVGTEQGAFSFQRMSVGEHLLLGGDNMDLALAIKAKADLEESGKQVDHWQFLSLISQLRIAKERLLDADSQLNEMQVSIASRGSSLFASATSLTITRADVETLVVNGFFPDVQANDPMIGGRSVGLHELGLHYESDAAVTRHLLKFLRTSAQNLQHIPGHADMARPNAILFNGGVFKSRSLRDRLIQVLKTCTNQEDLKILSHGDLDLAVARGAAYYGQLKLSGKGVRVRAGVARSYYIGVESNMPAVPGYSPPVMGLCVLPKDTEEGSTVDLPDRKFSLMVGQPVQFRFFSSTARPKDMAGSVVDDAKRDLTESDPLMSTMDPQDATVAKGKWVTVGLSAQVTEAGNLVVSMCDTNSNDKWNLEFNVRKD